MSDDLALKTAGGWLLYNDQAFAHFDYFKRQQDRSLLPRLRTTGPTSMESQSDKS
ncbi:hypothetical protein [Mesorhizobium sp.]|uniref:hypothetical protein n=1 Tax=Mesorhizobium sp. TaxID=1871066 RepID=UPI0025EEA029|nr:hypothetical protein [Mesorhizobium sp.]